MSPGWIYVLAGGGVIGFFAVVWFGLKTWLASMKERGAIEERARAAEGAREAEQEMADIQTQRLDKPDVARRLDEGTF